MTKKTKYVVIGLSVLSAAGLGYFIYSKMKISALNKKVSSLSEVQTLIDNIQVDDTPIEPTEPDVPMVSPDFGSDSSGGDTSGGGNGYYYYSNNYSNYMS